jgi:peptide/nickel transport system ATP-binding protein
VPIPGRPPSLIALPSGCSFHPRCVYVRERHRKVEPELEAVPDQNGHFVACLLDPATRRQLWAELKAGKPPEAVRESVGLKDSA